MVIKLKIYLFKFYLICILHFINVLNVNGQNTLCNDNDCGDVFATYSPVGSNVFCEGATVILKNTSSTKDFEVFYIDWGDGKKDTVRNYDDIKHVYTYSTNFKRCESNAKFNQIISYIGEKKCGAKKSCNTATTVVSVKLSPEASIELDNEFCISKTINFKENGCHGESFLWDFGDGKTSTERNPVHTYLKTGFYTVKLTATNECGSKSTFKSIKVVDFPQAGFTSNPSAGLCGPDTVQLKMNNDPWGRGSWKIEPKDTFSWKFLDSTFTLSSKDLKIQIKKTGDYKITHISQNACGTSEKTAIYKVYEPPIYSLNTPKVFCEKGVITEKDINFSLSGDIKSINWFFEGADRNADTSQKFSALTFIKSGLVNMKIETEVCGSREEKIPITVIQKPAISLSSNPVEFCHGSDTLTLKASPSGGKWSGIGIVDSEKGKFFPKDIKENTTISLLYSFDAAGCSSSDSFKIKIIPAPTLTLIVDSFCLGDSPKNLMGLPSGGLYFGKGVDQTTGIFSPSLSGPGQFEVTYTYNQQNGCQISAKGTVLVDRPPVINLLDTIIFCRRDLISFLNVETGIKTDSTGGTFTWKGIGVLDQDGKFNANLLPENQGSKLFVQYNRYACSINDSLFSKSIDNPILSLSNDTTLCIDKNTYELKSNIVGGVWSGNGINAQNGIINLSIPKEGEHIYSYIFRPETSCFQKGEVKIGIINPGLNISAGESIEICPEDGEITLEGAFPNGGTWNGPGLKDSQNPVVKTSFLFPGENKFIYCITDPINISCKACATKIVFLNPSPNAAFELSETICLNTPVKPVNKSKGAATFRWVTDENQVSENINPTFNYANAGNKSLRLEVQSQKKCISSFEKNFKVVSPANIQISLSKNEACAPFDLVISKEIKGDDIAIKWINGRDTVVSLEPPIWKLPGTTKDTIYKIEAIAMNSCAEVKDVKSVLIHPLPKVIFGTFPSEGCSPLSIKLANISQGGPLQYKWDFGNGNTSNDSIAQEQKYTLTGTDYKEFTLKLRAENACGKDSLEKKITVYKRDTEAFFEIDSLEGCPPFQLKAKSFSTIGSSLNWQLRNPDGEITSGNRTFFDQTLNISGTYQLILGATKCGTDTFETKINVLPIPKISFTLKDSYCLSDTIQTTIHTQKPENISGIYWNFGDENIYTTYQTSHIYKKPGKYNITLTAYSALNSCKSTFDKPVIIHPNPEVTLNVDKQAGCPPLSVNIKHAEEPGASYLWNFENDKILLESNPTYVFTKSGLATVQLKTTNIYGCIQTSKPLEILVYPKPKASFSLPDNEFCEFSSLSGLKNNSTGTIHYTWQWLDETYNDFEPSLLAYKQKGDYELQLTVKNNFGCQDSTKKSIRINTQSFADFELLSPSVCLGNSPIIINKSKNANQYQWFIGPNVVSTQANPLIKTTLTGDFPIRLITRQDNKCSDTVTLNNLVSIFPKPKADFDYRTDFINNTIGEVQFINQSLFSTRYYWDFGDGNTDESLGPLHEYDINRNIKVKLIAYADYLNSFTCSDTIIKEIAPEWITTFHAPNALAPESGNPGVQLFKPVGIGLKEYEIQIISPWGERVWFSNKLLDDAPAESWNGRKNNLGELLPQGAYIWQAKITFINGKNQVFTGSVNILR